MIKVGDNALITTDNWFYAPNGNSYRAVWGTVKAVSSDKEVLGINTNRNSTNWYVEIGNMIVAGCQIHYAVATDEPPPNTTNHVFEHDGKVITHKGVPHVYNANSDKSES
ncbi:hypothetical protein [Orrella sp. 11846]|uniref:hypothetical protein n=1 Tax=Orrella sp. 11846 TaxID=3409913 RepID=UPI003B5CAD03